MKECKQIIEYKKQIIIDKMIKPLNRIKCGQNHHGQLSNVNLLDDGRWPFPDSFSSRAFSMKSETSYMENIMFISDGFVEAKSTHVSFDSVLCSALLYCTLPRSIST